MLILAPVVYFIPDEGMKAGPVELNFLTLEDFNHPKKQENADITDILDEIDTSLNTPFKPLIKHKNGSNGNMGAPGAGSFEVDVPKRFRSKPSIGMGSELCRSSKCPSVQI